MCQWVINNVNVNHILASLTPSNIASIKLITRMGFVKIGSHIDGYEDVIELNIRGKGRHQQKCSTSLGKRTGGEHFIEKFFTSCQVN